MDHLIIDYQMPNLAQARLISSSNPDYDYLLLFVC